MGLMLYNTNQIKQCSIEWCETEVRARGFCHKHYARLRRHGDPLAGGRKPNFRGKLRESKCVLTDCQRDHYAKGLCQNHYDLDRRHGNINAVINRRKSRAKYKDKNGYIIWTEKGHIQADNSGRVLEHRAVMAEVIGRRLHSFEQVHHKNGVRDDNRPENLELWVTHQPSGQRPQDLLKWANEIITLYGD